MPEVRMLLLILAFGGVVAAVTVLIARFSGGRRLPKYAPALLTFAFAAYCLARAVGPSVGWDGLVFAVMTMLVGGVAAIALVTAVVIDALAARRARGKRED